MESVLWYIWWNIGGGFKIVDEARIAGLREASSAITAKPKTNNNLACYPSKHLKLNIDIFYKLGITW